MCGIAGFFLREEADSKAIAATMLDRIEHRGKDATGIAWWGLCDTDGNMASISEGVGDETVWHQKAPVPAKQFVRSMAIPEDAKVAIMHTRASTGGSPQQNENNHPITVADTIIGIHNGMIRNDAELWPIIGKDLRAAEVDSEVIFAALYALADGQPGTKEYGDTLRRLEGGAAIAWLDTREINKVNIARVNTSPLVIGWTEAGSMFFGSTKVTVEAAAKAGGLTLLDTDEATEGDLFTFGPEGVTMERFVPPTNTWGSSADWRSHSKSGGTTTTRTTTTSTRNGAGSRTTTNTAAAGFNEAERLVQSHSDGLRALSSIPIKEDARDYKKLYDQRETNLAKFVERESGKLTRLYEAPDSEKVENAEAKATEDAFDEAAALGGFLREGDWVEIDLIGKQYMGQIVSMPQSFPGGYYLIRAYLPASTGHDTCIVRRDQGEFSFVQSAGTPDAEAIIDAVSTPDTASV